MGSGHVAEVYIEQRRRSMAGQLYIEEGSGEEAMKWGYI